MTTIIDEIGNNLTDVAYVRNYFDHPQMTIGGSGNDAWYTAIQTICRSEFRLMQTVEERYECLFEKKKQPNHIDACRRVLRELCNTLTTLKNCLQHIQIRHTSSPSAEDPAGDLSTFSTIDADGFPIETLARAMGRIEGQMYKSRGFSQDAIEKRLDRGVNPQCYALYIAHERALIAYVICDVMKKTRQSEERPTIISMGHSANVEKKTAERHAQMLLMSILNNEIWPSLLSLDALTTSSRGLCVDEHLSARLKNSKGI
ncbi:MAG TPA: hypothetical protein VJB82_04940 [Candidatus Peribacterales bacterium]|nr:hypothetical protein [Candidatus Peribacterales bacterium]